MWTWRCTLLLNVAAAGSAIMIHRCSWLLDLVRCCCCCSSCSRAQLLEFLVGSPEGLRRRSSCSWATLQPAPQPIPVLQLRHKGPHARQGGCATTAAALPVAVRLPPIAARQAGGCSTPLSAAGVLLLLVLVLPWHLLQSHQLLICLMCVAWVDVCCAASGGAQAVAALPQRLPKGLQAGRVGMCLISTGEVDMQISLSQL